MFLEDVVAGALAVMAAFFFVLSIASYRRSGVKGLLMVSAVLLLVVLKNVFVIADTLWETFGGVFSCYLHFLLDVFLLVVLLALSFKGREG